MSDVDWPVLSAAVMQDVEPALDDAVTVFGKPGTRLVDSVRGKFSLRSENSIRDLTTVLVLADQAGRTDAFLRGADALRRVPFTGNVTLYEPIRQIHCGAHRRCVIDGRPNPFAELREVVEDGRSRSLLKGRSAGSALRTYYLDDALAADGGSHHVHRVCLAVRELYLMWATGGSWRWKLPRVDAEIERGAVALRHLRAISPTE